jgi:hypothetical protein
MHRDRKEVHVFRPKHTALLAGVVTTLALGGTGVAIAANGSGSGSRSSGTASTSTGKTTTTTPSSSEHCDHDDSGSSDT